MTRPYSCLLGVVYLLLLLNTPKYFGHTRVKILVLGIYGILLGETVCSNPVTLLLMTTHSLKQLGSCCFHFCLKSRCENLITELFNYQLEYNISSEKKKKLFNYSWFATCPRSSLPGCSLRNPKFGNSEIGVSMNRSGLRPRGVFCKSSRQGSCPGRR